MKIRPHIQIMNDIDRAAQLSLSDAKIKMRDTYLAAQLEIGKDAALDCLITCLFVSANKVNALSIANS